MRRIKEIDKWILAIASLLTGIGLIGIWLAKGGLSPYFKGQLLRFLLSLGAFMLFSLLNYRKLLNWAPWLYSAFLIILILLAFGKGISSWIKIGRLWFQPSEIGKFIIPLFLTWFLREKMEFPLSFKNFLATGIIVGIPMLLVALQPDLGTAFVYIAFILTVFLAFGLKKWIWRFSIVSAILIFFLAWSFFLQDYQKKRITSFLNPSQDPKGAAYQVYQSKISIGSGRLTGKGIREVTQAKLKFLPASHTDFIFSVIGEGFGFLGILALLLLYSFLFLRISLLIDYLMDGEAILLVLLLSGWIAYQAGFNLLIAVGLFPVTGIPLPLVSYGGSNLLSAYISLGIINSTLAWRWQ